MPTPPQSLPDTQYAVQLTGPSQLRLNTAKPVHAPQGFQILCKVEATGLCFSDLKLLKQFTDHPRKCEVVSGVERDVLDSNPSYVPGNLPTVPGHETVVRIVAVGEKVVHHKVGERCLVQTDYRGAITAAASNAAFGYNFEGGLQEYVIIDERISVDDKTGERLLIPVGDGVGASAVCLVEPWACVEDSYRNVERRTIKAGGRLLVVADAGCEVRGLREAFSPDGPPAQVTCACPDTAQCEAVDALAVPRTCAKTVAELPDKGFDDVVYFGTQKAVVEAISPKLGNGAICNIVTAGQKIGEPATIGVGRIHYGMTRWIGTLSASAADAYGMIPPNGEIRENDRCIVMGAGGPMGQMHVVRDICSGMKGLSVVATDFDQPRLDSLKRLAAPMASERGVSLRVVHPQKTPLTEKFTYLAIMVPAAPLVVQAIADAAPGALVNIFAGIPAPTVHPIDLDAVIEKRCFLFGTSGSTLADMRIVLGKVENGALDTNVSVDAVSGMAGAIDGIAAVENRTLAGKIIVYPQLHDLPLTPLARLAQELPSVAAKLADGRWTPEAEKELLTVANSDRDSACPPTDDRPPVCARPNPKQEPPMKLIEKYKAEVSAFAKVCHRLAANMYITAHGGNLAWKLEDDLILITPTMMNKGDIEPADLVFINRAGETIEGTRKPTGEKPMYLKFFADRPDIVSVVHCHPPYVCACAIMRGKNWLMRPLYPETITEVGPVPLVPYAEPLTLQLAANFSPFLQKYNSFIMQNHGLVTMSRSGIDWTLHNVELLESTAMSLLLGLSAGEIHELDRTAVENLGNVMTTRSLPLFGAPGEHKSLVDLYFPLG